MIFVRVAMSYMNYPRCGVFALVGVYPFLKNAVLGIRVRVSIRVRVRVNPNPKTPFFLKKDRQDRPRPRPRPSLLLTPCIFSKFCKGVC